MATLIKAEQVRQCFELDGSTGVLRWINVSKYHKGKIGKVAGNPVKNHSGKYYWVINWNGKKYKRGHLVYLMTHGVKAYPVIDHINGNSLDDRPTNLRAATVIQNAWNHKSRKRRMQLPMGVRVNKSSGKYAARISYFNKLVTIGTYETPELAQAAYLNKRKELYGDFS